MPYFIGWLLGPETGLPARRWVSGRPGPESSPGLGFRPGNVPGHDQHIIPYNFRFHVFFHTKYIFSFVPALGRPGGFPRAIGTKKEKIDFSIFFRFFYIFIITHHVDPMEPHFDLSDG